MARGGDERRWAALELVSTVRHDGNGGVLDELATAEQAAAWLAEHGHLPPTGEPTVDDALFAEVVAVRRAARALFARAVSPAPPSPADANRLMPLDEALAVLNTHAAADAVAPRLRWAAEQAPVAELASTAADPRARLTAALARSVIEFLAGPDREQLRACTAPRCVRYFVKSHGRQEWCKPSCGNRARVARHYDRQRQG
ncbi:ABATE domain-containing protein [Streptomyces sp. TLI_171]|uniref:CGNR zinc finger domain-containing protein n=1 Tax=Streptomyces sp. TLI_171 TaxID=1938859 RepID=UPI000C18C81D|nr:CGNR zinc finger domain-containing protein [Streptomyces sp. TLI_171]RKE17876.1 putative RNA-binding Zn ribbon-like protein [Streptomyces sp. TLI_171]